MADGSLRWVESDHDCGEVAYQCQQLRGPSQLARSARRVISSRSGECHEQ